jgi:hypothetical protein
MSDLSKTPTALRASETSGTSPPRKLIPFTVLSEAVRQLLGDKAHGFIPIKRPKGYRQRKAKACFANCSDLALDGRGKYCEGFAVGLADDGGPFIFAVHHAWVTLDGIHAIDPTLKHPGVFYFGIEYEVGAVAKKILAKPYRGDAQLDPPSSIIDLRVRDA